MNQEPINEDTGSDTIVQQPKQETHILAITSMILGILGLFMAVFCAPLMIVAGIGAAVCGHMALSRIRSEPERWEGLGFALAGTILGYANVALLLLLILFFVAIGVIEFLIKCATQ